MITIDDVVDALARLDGIAVRTPLIENPTLNEIAGGRVFVKAECWQRTGSFKIRGAYNLMSQLDARQAARGVVAWSSGNHAQGVACSGRLLGIQTTIVMPEDAPKAKLNNTLKYGAEVVTYDRYSGDREAIARAIATKRNAELVPSYDHEHIIAGQGTVGLEIAEQMAELELNPDQVLICCGGGGLTSGSAIALTARAPGVRVHTVEPADFDDTARSLAAGQRLTIAPGSRSICDALQADAPGRMTFEINRRLTSPGLCVNDEEVRRAMRFAFQQLKLVVEPGGAVALAAVLSNKLETAGKMTAIVISGGNVDADQFSAIQAESS